jgi:ABC-type bacteriocin/lantibiotic exporter with double-glycine peptidase domain
MALKPAIQDAPDATALSGCRGKISFRDVSFSYGQDATALQNINLEIEPGKQYALVGASGAGKTTMLSLMLRFYDPQTGVIDSTAAICARLRNDPCEHWYWDQTHSLSRYNLREHPLWLTDATEEIHVPQVAYAHDFILAQPEATIPSWATRDACARRQQQRLPSRVLY